MGLSRDRGCVHGVPIRLRACYAMPGTDRVHGAIGLRTRYAMAGTDLAYAATRWGTWSGCRSRGSKVLNTRPFRPEAPNLKSFTRNPQLF
eukprot:3427794-Rhodomonas_salina.1